MNNEKLRIEVRKLKVYQDIQYKEIAEYLEVKNSSFYNWLKGQFNLSQEKQNRLSEIIDNLKE